LPFPHPWLPRSVTKIRSYNDLDDPVCQCMEIDNCWKFIA